MGLVSAKEIAKVLKVDNLGFIGTITGWGIMQLLQISKLNTIYNRNKHLENIDFINAILNEFEIEFEYSPEELKRLPKQGPYITISNHPLGGIDGMLLLKLMLETNSDYKIIANFLLERIAPLKPYIMPVNPFENHKDSKSSIIGIKDALRHLSDGKPLGIFPAGEVSNQEEDDKFVDKPWEEGALKLIKKAEVPVVPIYFHAKNSKLFYWLSKLSPTLQTAKLPSELLSQKNRVIRVRFGKPITVSEQKEHADSIEKFGKFLRQKTYLLANTTKDDKKNFIKIPSLKFLNPPPENIEAPVTHEFILSEIERLRKDDDRLLQSKNYEVFLTKSDKIPNILKEIGRLREITFRAIGEGTNKSLDLDQFDTYYHHMFLWDDDAKCIAGAYRMGLGKEIYTKHGIDGFYLTELFSFDRELYSMLEQSIEMGRAFIISEYQQKPMPLFLLWKGIVHTTLRYPEHKYLIGGVSISNQFTDFSKSLMIEFMKSHFYDPYIAQYIRPKKEYKVKLKDADKDFVFNEAEADLNKFDKLIEEVEPNGLRLPVLIKKYIKQNARVVAFNVDPLFNNAIDGLMYIRIADLPESTVQPVIEEFQLELERRMNEKQND